MCSSDLFPGYYSYDLNLLSGYHPTFNDGLFLYTSPVGYFAPNGYGLNDMAGNQLEWTWDWSADYTASSATDPRGPTSGSNRLLRGGSWYNSAITCRAALRGHSRSTGRGSNVGFRSVLPPGQ